MHEVLNIAPTNVVAQGHDLGQVKQLRQAIELLSPNVDLELESILADNDLALLIDKYLQRKRRGDTERTLRAGLNKFKSYLQGEPLKKTKPKSYHKNVMRETVVSDPAKAIRLADIKADHLREYRQQLEGLGYALKSQAAYTTHVNTFLKWVCANTTLFVNLDELTINNTEDGEIHLRLPLTAQQQQAVGGVLNYTTTIGARDAILYRMGIELGLRIVEMSRLNMASFDMERGGLLVMGKGKRRAVFVKVDGDLWQLINTHFKNELQAYFAIDEKTRKETGFVHPPLFTGYKGKAMGREQIRARINGLFRAAGIAIDEPNCLITPHSLRHSLAHNLLGAGVPLEIVQLILRHKDISTTRTYSKVRDQMVRDTMSATALIREAQAA